MAKSRISADVRYANSALARFLMRQEEEDQILQIGKRKPAQEDEEKRLPVGRGRWRASFDFITPTCMVDRPRTLDGATSFHFAYETVTKRAVPVHSGKALEGLPRRSKQGAMDHAKYIERSGAPELSEASVHSEYLERDGAVEMIDNAALMRMAVERQIAIANGESPGPLRVTLPSVFSNISDDPEDRQLYWRQVEESERTPRSHELIFRPESSPLWWAELEAATSLEEGLHRHLLDVRQMSERHASKEWEEANFKLSPFKVKGKGRVSAEERAGLLLDQAMGLSGYDPSDPPIRFKSGSGGRTQIRMVAELPHELNAEDRARIVMRFCELLGSLETREYEDGTERHVGLMYTAVVHAPDAHNDHRNYHLHIVAHDRPARWLDEHGCWDFQFEEHFKHKGEKRVRRPFRQKKITQVSQGSHASKKQNSGRDFLPYLRREYARITNEMLEERGIARRYDPRTYAKMGIARTPTEHLGTAAAALESIGVPTAVGTLNAISIWRDAEGNISREVRQDEQRSRAAQIEFEKACVTLRGAMPDHTQLPNFERLVAERKRLSRNLPEDREALMQFDNLEAKAKSRATRTARTCQVYLSEIANERADSPISSMSYAIEARFNEANAHLNAIEGALEPHRRNLSEAGCDVKHRMGRIAEIDESLVELMQQSELAVRVNARIARNAEVARATRSLRDALKEADAKASKTVSSDHSHNGTKDKKADKEKRIADQRGAAAPITIDGIPIVEPTIPPTPIKNQTSKADTGKAAAVDNGSGSTESQLEEVEKATKDLPGVFQTTKQASLPARTHSDAIGEKLSAKSVTVPAKSSVEQKILKNARLEEHWNRIMDKIHSQRIPIVCVQKPQGTTHYSVPNLSDEEQHHLAVKKFVSRTSRRLEAFHSIQRKEVSRLCKWIAEHGHRPDMVILDGEGPSLGIAGKGIKTLWRNWNNDAQVVAAIRAAREARQSEQVRAGLKADHQSEIAGDLGGDNKLSETISVGRFSSTDCSLAAESLAPEEKLPKNGSEFGRQGGSYEHEDDEAASNSPPPEQASENTGDDEWLRTLGAFASRNGRKGRG